MSDDLQRTTHLHHTAQEKNRREFTHVKQRLHHERNLKLDAFQRVDELQTQVYDYEAAMSSMSRPFTSMSKGSLSAIFVPCVYIFVGWFLVQSRVESAVGPNVLIVLGMSGVLGWLSRSIPHSPAMRGLQNFWKMKCVREGRGNERGCQQRIGVSREGRGTRVG